MSVDTVQNLTLDLEKIRQYDPARYDDIKNALSDTKDIVDLMSKLIDLDANIVNGQTSDYNQLLSELQGHLVKKEQAYKDLARLADEAGVDLGPNSTVQQWLDDAAAVTRQQTDALADAINQGVFDAQKLEASLQKNLSRYASQYGGLAAEGLDKTLFVWTLTTSLNDILIKEENQNAAFAALGGAFAGLLYGAAVTASGVLLGATAGTVVLVVGVGVGIGLATEYALKELGAWDVLVDGLTDVFTFVDPVTRDLFFEQDGAVQGFLGQVLDLVQEDIPSLFSESVGAFSDWLVDIFNDEDNPLGGGSGSDNGDDTTDSDTDDNNNGPDPIDLAPGGGPILLTPPDNIPPPDDSTPPDSGTTPPDNTPPDNTPPGNDVDGIPTPWPDHIITETPIGPGATDQPGYSYDPSDHSLTRINPDGTEVDVPWFNDNQEWKDFWDRQGITDPIELTFDPDFWNPPEPLDPLDPTPPPPPPPLPDPPPTPGSPLALDLDGDGIETVGFEADIHFDHDGDDFKELSGFIAPDDGLLALDRNNDGVINNGGELFGNATVLADGTTAEHGFAALSELDSNNDGTIDQADERFSELRIFRDLNQDGESSSDELQSLDAAGIESLSLDYTDQVYTDANGNDHRQTGSYTTANGNTLGMTDIWFTRNLSDTETAVVNNEQLQTLPDAKGFGTVASLHQTMNLDSSGELQALVSQFVNASTTKERQALIEPIIFAWSGQEGAYADHFQSPIDTRKIGALEAFYGYDLDKPRGSGQQYAALYEEIFANFADSVFYQLTANTLLAPLFNNISWAQDADTGNWRADFSHIPLILFGFTESLPDQANDYLESFILAIQGATPGDDSNLSLLRDAIGDYMANYDVSAYSQSALSLVASIAISGVSLNNDALYGDDDDNYLSGLAGDDFISGEDGNDVLDGGNGNDDLVGGAGSDEYRFGIGSGQDRIFNQDASADRYDIVRLDEGLTPDDISVLRQGDDLLIVINETQDLLRVDAHFNQDTSAQYHIDAIFFDDGSWFNVGPSEFSRIDLVDENFSSLDAGIYGSANNDYLTGGDNEDRLYGGNGDDFLIAREGNDRLHGEQGNDLLLGAEGDDALYGGEGRDNLDGGENHDTLVGGFGDDYLKGGSGDDFLIGGRGNDTYRFDRGDGLDLIDNQGGFGDLDTLVFGLGILSQDLIVRRSGDDLNIIVEDNVDEVRIKNFFVDAGSQISGLIFNDPDSASSSLDDLLLAQLSLQGSQGNDQIEGTRGDDIINGLDGDDFLVGDDGVDSLSGAAGDDNLQGGNGNDQLDGGEGADKLWGGRGDDTLIGGSGTNYLSGDHGSDAYAIAADGSHNIIQDYDSTGSDINRILLGEGISPNDLSVRRDLDDRLIMDISANNNVTTVTIVNGLSNVRSRIDLLEFFDGTTLDFNELLHDIDSFVGTTGDDAIKGYEGNDSLDGADGNDRLYGEEGNDNLLGGSGNDFLYGGAGDDYLDGGEGSDNLQGGSGNDTLRRGGNGLSGGTGNDTYLFGRGDGNTRIYDGSGQNVLRFLEGITPEDVSIGVARSDVLLNLQESNEVVVLAGFLSLGANRQITVEFVNGTIWDANTILNSLNPIGTDASESVWGLPTADAIDGQQGDDSIFGVEGNDTLRGGEGDDSLYGDTGDDTLFGDAGNDQLKGGFGDDHLSGGSGSDALVGGDGNDTYHFSRGDDQITIYNIDNATDRDDVLRLQAGITVEDIRVTRSGNHLQVEIIDTQDIATVNDFFVRDQHRVNERYAINAIEFFDGPRWDQQDLLSLVQQASDGDDTFYGSAFDDNHDGQSGDDILYGFAGSDILRGGEGADTLYGDAYSLTGISSEASGDDILDGGVGNDSLHGGYGADTYLWGYGDGNDRIYANDLKDATAIDQLRFKAGVTADDIQLSRSSTGSLIATVLSTGEQIEVINYFNGSYYSDDYPYQFRLDIVFDNGERWDAEAIENQVYSTTENDDTIFGSDGDDIINGKGGEDRIFGNDGNDTLRGGAGDDNDFLQGDAGNDTYLFARGDGNITINNYDWYAGSFDRLSFVDVASDEVSIERNYRSLTITVEDSGEVIWISDFFSATSSGQENYYALDSIEFSDGVNLSLAEIKQMMIAGTEAEDDISGYGGDESYDGMAGDDYIAGGFGSDTYLFGYGDGNDVISEVVESGAINYLRFKTGISPEDVSYRNEGIDLEFILNNTGDSVIIRSYFSSTVHAPTNFQVGFVDHPEVIWTADELLLAALPATDEDDHIIGTDGSDVLDAQAGDDQVEGRDGDDQLLGGLGDDRLSGNEGNDDISGGEGDDRLYGYEDNDYLLGGPGNDTLRGDVGDDILDGGPGNDYLVGDEGNDTYLFGRGDGQDEISNNDDPSVSVDILRFKAGILPEDVLFERMGSTDLKISIRGTDDHVEISRYFSESFNNALLIERIEFEDDSATVYSREDIVSMMQIATDSGDKLYGGVNDDVLDGEEGNDRIFGENGRDTLIGGEGDDYLRGGLGIDTYVFNMGDGFDTIFNNERTTERSDILQLGEGIDPSNVSLFGFTANDTLVKFNHTNDLILITGRWDLQIHFADGQVWDKTAIDDRSQSLAAYTSNVNSVAGAESAHGYLDSGFLRATLGGDERDNILIGRRRDANTLNGLAGADIMFGGSYTDFYNVDNVNDVVSEEFAEGGHEGTDTIFSTVNYTAPEGIEHIYFSGNNITYGAGNAGNNIIYTAASAMLVEGGEGDDVYVIKDNDTVIEQVGEGNDMIVFSGDAGVYRLGDHAHIENAKITDESGTLIGDDNNNILYGARVDIVDSLYNPGRSLGNFYGYIGPGLYENTSNIARGSNIQGGGGDDTIITGDFRNEITGGLGDDDLRGGGGSDQYFYALGDGDDVITDGSGNDTLHFDHSITLDDVSFGRDKNDLLIHVGENTLRIKHSISNSSYAIEFFAFADGTTLTLADVELLVIDANVAPYLEQALVDQNVNEEEAFSFTLPSNLFSDAEGDHLTFFASLTGGEPLPSWLSFNANTQTFSGTPGNDDVGTLSISVHVDDGYGGLSTADFIIRVDNVNDPITANNDQVNTAINVPLVLGFDELFANDSDIDVSDSKFITAISNAQNGRVTVNSAEQTLTFTPSADYQGEASFEYTVSDGNGSDSTATVTIHVTESGDPDDTSNNNPVTDPVTMQIDFGVASQQTTGWNTMGNTLNNTLSLLDSAGNATGVTLTLTDSFISTNTSGTQSGLYEADVTGDSLYGHLDDTSGGFLLAGLVAGQAYNLRFFASRDNISDNRETQYTVTGSTTDTGVLDPANNQTNTVSLTAIANSNGELRVEAGFGANNNGGYYYLGALVIETVDSSPNSNNAPTVAEAVNDQTAAEDSAFIFTLPANTFSDADGDSLSISATLSDGSALPGWLTFDAITQTFSGTPEQRDVGSLSIDVIANDGNGGTVSNTFVVDVSNTNDAPITVDDADSVDENDVLTLSFTELLANDNDIDGDSLTITAVNNAVNGVVSMDTLGQTITFTPTTDYQGPASFDYIVSDGNGGTDTATVSLIVDEVADPVASDPLIMQIDFGVGSQQTAGWNTVGNTFNNALSLLDPEGNATGVTLTLTDSFVSTNSSGAESGLYAPDVTRDSLYGNLGDTSGGFLLAGLVAGQAYTLRFFASRDNISDNRETQYTVTGDTTDVGVLDPANNQTHTVTLTAIANSKGELAVEAGFGENNTGGYYYLGALVIATDSTPINNNNAPIAVDDADSVDENDVITLSFTELLANDSDIDGDSLTITAVSNAANGTVSIDTVAETITFTPTADYTGPASFDYTVSDGNDGTDTATVNLIVDDVTDPVASDPLTMQIDFGVDTHQTAGWNTVGNTLNNTLSLLDSEGSATGASITLTDSFASANASGTQSGLYASHVTSDSLYGHLGDTTAGLLVEGLIAGQSYNLTFFASRDNISDNRETQYTVTGSTTDTGVLDPANNQTHTVTLTAIANSKGELRIEAGLGANNVGGYYYLGALVIETASTAHTASASRAFDGSAGDDQVETIIAGGDNSAVEQLVQAMAVYGSPSGGEIVLANDDQQQVNTLIATDAAFS